MSAIDSRQSENVSHNGLIIEGVGKVYGETRVLDEITFDVRPGEVLALLGENGAGKSTISNIIAGVTAATEGKMYWNGKLYKPSTPSEALAYGIRLIHQEIRLLPELSIAENIFVGFQKMKHGRIDTQEMERLAGIQLKRLGLHVSPKTKVKELSVAAQQQVEIAKSLTLNANLMILDEPTAALGGEEVEHLFAQVELLKAQGVSFIYISHRLDEIAQIADRVVVFRDGRLINVHDTAQLPVKTLVAEMVGRNVDRMFPDLPTPQTDTVLEVRRLCSASDNFKDISFSVQAGEIFGIAGIVGAGRTELVRAIYGADPYQSGEIYLEGERLKIRSPGDAIAAGIVLVPEDRKQQALIVDQLIGDNVAFGNFDQISRSGWAFPRAVNAFTHDAIQTMGVKGTISQTVGSLSGGNQQKVIIAKWIARNPKVFILDEPTRGIDVGARAAIYDVINGLARQGMAVIVVSSDLDEVLGLSNRVMVLAHGDQQGILSADEANQISVMELATR
jgi:ribose transport system ATP-binding protein